MEKSWQQYFVSFYNEKGSHIITYSPLVHAKKEVLDYVSAKFGKVSDLVIDKVI